MIPVSEKISNTHYVFLVVAHLMGYALVISFTDTVARQDSWLVALGGLILFIPFLLTYTHLAKRFPDSTLFDIFKTVYGKVFGTALSAVYAVYFLMVFSYYLRDIADFYAGYIMVDTPPEVFGTAAVLVAAYALGKGIRHLPRLCVFAAATGLLIIVITFLLLAGDMDFQNFLPILSQPTDTYVQSVSQFMLVPCAQLLYLLMLTPKLRSVKKLGKMTLLGFAIAGTTFIVTLVRNTSVLGPEAGLVYSASYEAVRMINAGQVFTRMELLIALSITFLLFINVCVIYYATVHGLAGILGLKTDKSILLPVGGIAVVLSMINFGSTVAHLEFALKYNVPAFAVFHFVIPPVTLLVARLRRLKGVKARCLS